MKKNTKKSKYCERCGSKLERHFIDRYDKLTGKQIASLHCPNLKCTEGCGHDGHQWGKIWKLQSDHRCLRCGYTEPFMY